MASSVVRMLNRNRILRFLPPSSFAPRAAMSSSSSSNPSGSSKTSPPWLMLPSDNMAYNFHNLSENRVESFGLPDFHDKDDDTVLVGSSHGWLAFFNRRNNHVFLTNPLSGRRFNLPPFENIPDTEATVKSYRSFKTKLMLPCTPPLSKLILSHSPEHADCRAMVSFGPGDSLAFCSPGHSDSAPHWTPISDLLFPHHFYVDAKDANNDDYFYHGRPYEDFVFCDRRKLFSCISQFWINLNCWVPGRQFEGYERSEHSTETHFEDWDLHVDPPKSRVCYGFSRLRIHGDKCSWVTENKELLESCTQIPYLVCNDDNNDNQPFIVIRFVMNDEKTVGFSVLKLEYQPCGVRDGLRFVESLDGLAVFVGMNHTFAVSAAAESGLEPNSIYFTDATKTRLTPPTYHGDVGIFDYGNKTISPFPGTYSDYFSRGDKVTLSTPIWFTPAGHS